MVSFGNFAKIAGFYESFHLGTMHGYLFSLRRLTKFDFPSQTSNKTCLKGASKFVHVSRIGENSHFSHWDIHSPK